MVPALVEEATVDCNDEEEALTGFATLPPKGTEWIAAYRHWAR
jgi:hypothetical protein